MAGKERDMATTAPAELVLVRHGESVGNIAAAAAGKEGLARLDLDYRDPDTPLSDNGVAQAKALGEHLAQLPEDQRPEVVLGSPYVRAASTMELALQHLPDAPRPVHDERLRERDLGLFDGMTGHGIREKYPEEADRRASMGKFYYRPPGGESWTDVVLRIRSLLTDVRAEHAGRRVWVFSHQAVIMAFRYLLESLTEEELLRIDGETPLGNCSRTHYRPTDRRPSRARLVRRRRPPRGLRGRADPRGVAGPRRRRGAGRAQCLTRRPDEPPVVTPPLLRDWPLPDPDGSKDAKGRLLVVGGSDRTPGAVLLAAEAALRVGAGKVQVATTASTAAHLATAVPEAFVVGLDTDGGEIATSAAGQLLELRRRRGCRARRPRPR